MPMGVWYPTLNLWHNDMKVNDIETVLFSLEIRHSDKTGIFYVTSPEHPGLLVVGHDLSFALKQVPTALDELKNAIAIGET